MTFQTKTGGALRGLLMASTIVAFGALSAVPAVAQADGASQGGGIEDIVVTARKRVETTQDVPVSVTAISAEQIDRYDLTNLEKVAASTPSFSIGRSASGSGATLVLRGIGSNTTSIGLEQSVAVVVDGVYYGQGRTINEGFFDLGRLELLKGPQALFFGKNATAGVVSITSADPGDELEVMARAGYEIRSENIIGETVISSPLSDTLGVRLALRGTKMYGGYFKNGATDQNWRTTDVATGTVTNGLSRAADSEAPGGKEFMGRLTLKWQPDDRLTATLKASMSTNKVNNPASNYSVYSCPVGGISQRNPTVTCGKNFKIYQNNFREDIAKTLPYAYEDGALGNAYKSWAVTGTINYDLENISFTWVNNYNWNRNIFRLDGDIQSAPNVGIAATEWSTWGAFSSEFRALTNYDGPVNLMVGMLYQKTKRDYLSWTAANGLENSAAPAPEFRYVTNSKDSETKGETIAGFGQVVFKPIEQVEVAGGVRYTHETKDSFFIQPYSHPTLVSFGVFKPNDRITADQTFNNWSPEATISYKPSRDVNIYAAYKTAYKSGGFSNSGIWSPTTTVNTDFAFKPEKAKGFEAGVKTMLFDRQLRFNVGVYRYKYNNLQIDFFNAPVFAFTTTNAGSATTKGVEVEFEYAPMQVDGLNIRGSLNYNKARYGSFPSAPCFTGQTPAQGCYTTVPRPQQDLEGKPTANAPLWTASLGVNYETPISNSLVLGMSVDSRYSDDYLASGFGHPGSKQNSYVNLDASLRLKTSDDQWEFAVIGKNLTNRFYATGHQDAPSTGGGTGTVNGVWSDQVGFITMPRTVQLQLTWRY